MDAENPPVLGNSYAVYDETRSPITPTVERPPPGASMQYYQQDGTDSLYVGPSTAASSSVISQTLFMLVLGACYVFFGIYFLVIDKNKVMELVRSANKFM